MAGIEVETDDGPLYSAEQIKIPPDLAMILKHYTKAVIRGRPDDILAFSEDWFRSKGNTYYSKNGNVRVHYEIFGDPEGKPIVCIHNWMQSLHAWKERDYLKSLESSGLKIVLIDLRGHGKSSITTELQENQLSQFTSDVIAVMDDLRISKAILWGYFYGARIIYEILKLYPTRVRLAILGGATPTSPSVPLIESVKTSLNALEKGMEFFIQMTTSEDPILSKEHLLSLNTDAMYSMGQSVLEWPDVSQEVVAMVHKYRIPCLVYNGSSDPLTRAYNEKFCNEQKSKEKNTWEFFVVEGSDHDGAWKASSKVLPTVLQAIERAKGL